MGRHVHPPLAWRIKVHGYQFPGSVGKLDSDWLRSTLEIHTPERTVRRRLKFLYAEDLGLIIRWLELVQAGHRVQYLEFVDEEPRLMTGHDGRTAYMVWRNGEDWPLAAEFGVVPGAVDGYIAMVREQAARFPCRCGQPHDHRPLPTPIAPGAKKRGARVYHGL